MKNCKLVMSAIAASTLLATAGTALAATADSAFAMKAAQGGMAEVKAAQLAQQKTKSPAVKAFAQRMIADHTKNNSELVSILRTEGVTPPGDVNARQMAEMARLKATSGGAFDGVYLKGQVADHQQMIALLQQEASSGKDPKLVAFAKATMPVVQQHLALAKQDSSKM